MNENKIRSYVFFLLLNHISCHILSLEIDEEEQNFYNFVMDKIKSYLYSFLLEEEQKIVYEVYESMAKVKIDVNLEEIRKVVKVETSKIYKLIEKELFG